MPWRDFQTLTEENPSILFCEIRDSILSNDWEYFAELAENHGRSCLVVCDVDYDKEVGLVNSIDLSMFPKFLRVKIEEITNDQAKRARAMRRDVGKEAAKLISTNITGTIHEFVDSLAFMTLMMSVKITRVRKILLYKQAAFFKDYIEYLQKIRGQSPSPILGKIIKSLGYA